MIDKHVLIDTSVWIDYFRQSDEDLEKEVENLIQDDEVCTCSLVLAELLHGARDKKEQALLEEHFVSLHWLEEESKDWIRAGRLAFAMKKKGKTTNLSDCYLAILAQDQKCQVYSLDKHLKMFELEGVLRLYSK